MSLDGVIDAPTWTFEYGFHPQMGEAIGAVTERCRGILLGRTTYEMFEPAWSTRTVEDDPGAPFFNDTTKYVVSATLTTATWRNSKIIGPYDPDAIRSLKDEVDGDLYTSGSGTLVRAMLADSLVDELHLFVYPLTRGSGPRLFPEDAAPGKLSLAAAESYENGVVYLAYRPQASDRCVRKPRPRTRRATELPLASPAGRLAGRPGPARPPATGRTVLRNVRHR
jgi:dihydrofolate reductase